jgi:N-alpha-acetyltransferase 35, NatC auxiliary subunit
MEDWQGEKCEVTLLEGVPVDMVLRKLDEAYVWLRDSEPESPCVDAICDRLALHKVCLLLAFRENIWLKHICRHFFNC